jgi:hypothetical protein
MALTLKQRINVKKGVPLTDSATFVELAKEALQKAAQNVLDGTITIADTEITGKGVSETQLIQWALRVLDGSFDSKMLPMILDSNVVPADPATITDPQMYLAVKRSIWPYAKLIGSGGQL